MSSVVPQSELLRRAVQYVSDMQKDHPEKKIAAILDDTSMRFNLSPLDSETLYRLFSKKEHSSGSETS